MPARRPKAPRTATTTAARRKAADPVGAVVADIAALRVRGAAAIGVAAARALAEDLQGATGSAAQTLARARRTARRLDAARPTAVTLHNALGWVLAAVAAEGSAGAQKRAALATARLLRQEVEASRATVAAHGARHVPDGGVVLTHCHSSTAVAILAEAHRQGKSIEAIATETRPFRQGLRTANQLAQAGVPTAYVVDSAVGHVLATRDVDLVLVGADTVAADGTLVNKVGTSTVALLAAEHEVPFHAAAGLHKFTRRRADEVPIEERPRGEVVAPGELPAGVQVLNPVFDRTPPRLVKAYVTESGLASPAQAVRRNAARLPPEAVWG